METREKMDYNGMLRREVERAMGFRLTTPRDFARCSDRVLEVTSHRLSMSTLKRMWGYVRVSETYSPSAFTLDTLSHFLHYKSYKDYCNVKSNSVPGSTPHEVMECIEQIHNHATMLDNDIRRLHDVISELFDN